MFDVSREPFEENLARTKAASELIHAAGISLEAELGHVGGRETAEQVATQSTMTVPLEAAEFVRETQCDSLAICVGNAHGLYKGTPKLDFGLIAELRATLPCGLALHGGSGLPDADLVAAVRAGITKMSIYTDMSIVQVAAVRAVVADPNRYVIFPEIVASAKASARELVAAKNQLYGSAGRA
jgi:fructose-bisphosphate aldolase class II